MDDTMFQIEGRMVGQRKWVEMRGMVFSDRVAAEARRDSLSADALMRSKFRVTEVEVGW